MRQDRFFKLFPYILVTSLGIIPILWFFGKWNYLISGVDINFPLDPVSWFERRFFVWNSVSNAGVDFSSSTAGLFFHLIQVIPYTLGFNLTQVQIISLIFWFLLIVFAAYFLAKIIFPKNLSVQILFVVLYSFNIYMFNSWENIKVANLSLVASIPLALSVLFLLHDKKITYNKVIFLSSVIGIIVSGGGINPSYFITFFLILFIYILGDYLVHIKEDSLKTTTFNFLIVTVTIILVNLFWILPTINFISNNLSPGGSIDKLGFTNWVDSLSEHTSLVNIFRLQGAWDWYALDELTNQPLYIPYALNYFFRVPFILFSFLLPSLAFLSFLFVNKQNRNLYAVFGLMLVTGVFLGAGTHLPTGTFFRWLLDHVPFFTLFRSPWYIFSPLVTLSYAVLICLFLFNFRAKKIPPSLNKVIVLFASAVLVIGNLIYSYPLITGKIFRPTRVDGFYIKFPDYVYDAKKWLDENKDGRIIGYPDDEIEKFRWGYRGIESLLNLLSRNETLFSPLNVPDSPVALLIKEFHLKLKRGQIEAASSIARKMSVEHLFEKKDQDSLTLELSPIVKNFPKTNFGEWNFYEFPERTLPKIYLSKNIMLGETSKKNETKMLGILEDREIFASGDDSEIKKIQQTDNITGRVILTQNSQQMDLNNFVSSPSILKNRLIKRNLTNILFTFQVLRSSIYIPILERYRLEDFGINPSENLIVKLDGMETFWEIMKATDSYVYYKPFEMSVGNHSVEFKLSNNNLISGGEFESEKFEKVGSGEFSLSEGPEKYLSLLNKGEQDISVTFSVNMFDPLTAYLVQYRYKQIYGNNGLVLVGQNTPTTLVKTNVERLPNYPEWNNFSFYYDPVKTSSVMKVNVVAPQTKDPLGTKVLYDNIEVFKVFTNNLLFKEQSQHNSSVDLNFNKISTVEYEGMVLGEESSHVLVFSENYSPNWQLELIDIDGAKIDAETPHFSANLFANAWYIKDVPESYKFKIYNKSQRLFWAGMGFSALTLILGLTIFLKDLRSKNV